MSEADTSVGSSGREPWDSGDDPVAVEPPADADTLATTAAAILAAAVEALGGAPREGQITMTRAVTESLARSEHLVVQAGTGTGKSLAYLSAAGALIADGRGPLAVSTATLALQHQLVRKDLPVAIAAVQQVTGRTVRAEVVKGRGNYACLRRIMGADDDAITLDLDGVGQGGRRRNDTRSGFAEEVARVHRWAEESIGRGSGDRDDLTPAVSDQVWSLASVGGRECVGATMCRFGHECFAERARANAADADLLVANHAVLALTKIKGHPLLPDHRAVIIDEAHELVSRVTTAATDEIIPSRLGQTVDAVRTIVDRNLVDAARDALDRLRTAVAAAGAAAAVGGSPAASGAADEHDRLPDALRVALDGFAEAAKDLHGALGTAPSGVDPGDIAIVRGGLADAIDAARRAAQADSTRDVAWVIQRSASGGGAASAIGVAVAPIDVSGTLGDKVFDAGPIVLTSATLSLGGSLDAVAAQVGLGSQRPWRGLDVGSPFDYRRQAILYVARDLPAPGRTGLDPVVLDRVADLVRASGGGALGLFSSRAGAEAAAAHVRRILPEVTVLLQGESTLAAQVEQYRDDAASCLFGTLSLWQGVDAPGLANRLVIIDRIPFPRPDDPLMRARTRAVEQRGGSGFAAVSLTHAGLLLAQGAGRLVRRVDDRGVVAVLDSRLVTRRYGTFLRRSMSPMWATTDLAVTMAALQRLAAQASAAPSSFDDPR